MTTLVDRLVGRAEKQPSCGVLPQGVRVWIDRGDAVGLAIEVPAGPRTVRWISSNSKSPYGKGAEYEPHFLSFPYIEILVVFHRGALATARDDP